MSQKKLITIFGIMITLIGLFPMIMASKPTNKPNRLIKEKSPYLLQHATNPVDWYPWGEEAFAAAKSKNLPIFLSVGYSTCHWCHVMEHESFSDPAVAKIMNDNFINIKVDREERPDVDAIYMSAVQALTGRGGWPMSVWLNHDLKPFFGGTYFPPDDRYGLPGFTTVLTQVSKLWKEDRARLNDSARHIFSSLKEAVESRSTQAGPLPESKEIFDKAFLQLSSSFDSTHGGFGSKPKFPNPGYMEFLLLHYFRTGNKKALHIVDMTLKKMAEGGIYDQLGGGFSRYSTDEKWIQPHFEKMLYDNAQLISILAKRYQIDQDPVIKKVLQETLEYILRDMTHPEGGFYSAEDADSEGKEGKFYLWTLTEIKNILGSGVEEIFIERYGVDLKGNFEDPHSDEVGQNILVISKSLQNLSEKFKKPAEEIEKILTGARLRLFNERAKRIRPHLDDKILTEWNGLMISALSQAAGALNDPAYLTAAVRTAQFIENNIFDPKSKKLYRRWRDGERAIEGQQIDYALLIQGLIDLYQGTGEIHWLEWAFQLNETQNRLFYDPQDGGYFMNVERNDLLMRIKNDQDNVIPSGNSVAALNNLKLAKLTNNKELEKKALQTLSFFKSAMAGYPSSLAFMLTALDYQGHGNLQVIILGSPDQIKSSGMLSWVRQQFLPGSWIIPVHPGKDQSKLGKLAQFVGPMKMIEDKATAYVCVNYACNRPTASNQDFEKQINAIKASSSN